MKIVIVFLSLIFPATVFAQNQVINGVDMGNIMQLMQEMQTCMAKVDQTEMKAFEVEAEKLEAEIKTLCQEGKRKKAQKKAVAFGKKAMKNPAIKQMQKCGEITKGMLPENSEPSFEESFDFSDTNVCDE